jgi:hypothetical protein
MPAAAITINSILGSNDDLTINTPVSLDNQNIGGESTFAWTILDQPPGTVDNLNSSSIQNPTFTPKKEGTYLIELVVNANLPTQQTDKVIIGIRDLKTRERIPAVGETIEDSVTGGWAEPAMSGLLRRTLGILADPGLMIGIAGASGLVRGNVVRISGSSTIKAGLPGEEVLASFTKAQANTLANVDETVCLLERGVNGSLSPLNGTLVQVRQYGRVSNIVLPSGGILGDMIYVTDAGVLDIVPGTIRRQCGSIIAVGVGVWDIWFNGLGGADITPIDAPYLIFGNPGVLTNAVRIDGANAYELADSVVLKSAITNKPTLVIRKKSGQTASLLENQNEASGVLSAFDSSGNLGFAGTGAQSVLKTTAGGLSLGTDTSGGDVELKAAGVTLAKARADGIFEVDAATSYIAGMVEFTGQIDPQGGQVLKTTAGGLSLGTDTSGGDVELKAAGATQVKLLAVGGVEIDATATNFAGTGAQSVLKTTAGGLSFGTDTSGGDVELKAAGVTLAKARADGIFEVDAATSYIAGMVEFTGQIDPQGGQVLKTTAGGLSLGTDTSGGDVEFKAAGATQAKLLAAGGVEIDATATNLAGTGAQSVLKTTAGDLSLGTTYLSGGNLLLISGGATRATIPATGRIDMGEPSFVTPSLLNGWTQYNNFGWWCGTQKEIKFNGLVKCPNPSNIGPIFIMPSTFRPNFYLTRFVYDVTSNSFVLAHVDSSTGEVSLSASIADDVYDLSAIDFIGAI